MRTTNLPKIHHALMTIFIAVIITLCTPSYANNNQKIPEAFTKGTWLFLPSNKAEIDQCKGQSTTDYGSIRTYTFNSKTNSIKMVGYEDTTNIKILSFSEITPTSIKGKAKYAFEHYEGVDIKTRNFDFMIKDNRLYSSSEFPAKYYDERERKQGLYHCIKSAK